MEAPDTCSRCCACKFSVTGERIEREAFWASPEGIKRAKEKEDQKELERISRLPKEVSKEQYEKTQSEYDPTLKDIFDEMWSKED